ncbi:MAG: hypothetical protein Q7S00_07530, partial [bacterium]|nr:hypothetical protein [bacterium]
KNIPSDNSEKRLLDQGPMQEVVLQQPEPLSEDEIKERAVDAFERFVEENPDLPPFQLSWRRFRSDEFLNY